MSTLGRTHLRVQQLPTWDDAVEKLIKSYKRILYSA